MPDEVEIKHSIDKDHIEPLAYVFIIVITLLSLLWVYQQSKVTLDNAVAHYMENVRSNSLLATEHINDAFKNIYKSLRTISALPSVRKIDRYGTNIDDDDHATIQQIYNDLAYDINVSKVYIVPLDFDHTKIDKITGKPQEPTMMFDKHIKSEEGEGEPEVEDHEYDYFTRLMQDLKQDPIASSHFSQGHLPVYSSPILITYDNTVYNTTKRDEEREGIILSVPFFDKYGHLKGVVAAIIRTRVFKDTLPNAYISLVHNENNTVISKEQDFSADAQTAAAMKKSVKNTPAAKPLFSEVIPLKFSASSGWSVYVSYPSSSFYEGNEAKVIQRTTLASYILCILLSGLSMWAFYILKRRMELEKENARIEASFHEKETLEMRMAEHIENVRLAHNRALQAVAAAEKADEAKSDFLANMSHELRTPMNSIIGMTRLLVEEKDLNDEAREMVEIVNKSARSLLEILNDILDLSKIEAKGLFLEIIPFDMRESAARVVETLAPLASEKGLTLSCHLDPDIPTLMGDPLRFGRILTNLVGNAIKYTYTGQVELSLKAAATSDDKIMITGMVTDTGIGIPEEKLSLIFEKFTQADASTTRQFGGTGLGLAITRHLIDLMGGEIGVSSKVGQGSAFSFSIPFACAGAADNKTEATSAIMAIMEEHADRIKVGEATVLIAEDHPMNQILIRKLLKRLGIEHIDMVEDGVQAMNAIAERRYDLIFMDCHMPMKNGYDTAREIRALGMTTPIIAMTANAMVGDKERCLEAGMDDYVSKPIDPDTLRQVMSRWLDLS